MVSLSYDTAIAKIIIPSVRRRRWPGEPSTDMNSPLADNKATRLVTAAFLWLPFLRMKAKVDVE